MPSTDLFASRSDRFREAIEHIDRLNAQDPNTIEVNGTRRPYELVYSEWVTRWVLRLCPEASEALLLAARSQHICRWMVPRNSYEMTRSGYLRWREGLKHFHAEKSGAILKEAGYPEDFIAHVRELNLKKNIAGDPDCRVLEDALCLVTLEHQFTDLIRKTDPEKMVSILQKTWNKMSDAGHEAALTISFTPEQQELIAKALGDAGA